MTATRTREVYSSSETTAPKARNMKARGKREACIDRGHPKHTFGDMVNTFSGGDTFRLERSREDALESEFHHVNTS